MTQVASPPNEVAPGRSAGGRLVSVDALRGFDMLWIIGAQGVGRAFNQLRHTPLTESFADQLYHKDWEGFGFYDLIFPLFILVVGLSLVFSLPRIIERQGKKAAYWRIVKRSLILYLLGVFYYGGLSGKSR